MFGRLAAICLRIYQLSDDSEYYYSSLNYYRKGAEYCKNNLYCPRNYCAMLLRIQEITDDVNIIKEYYYTAKHYAKLFLHLNVTAPGAGEYDDRVFYSYNVNDLRSIVSGEYIDYEKIINRLQNDADISIRQKTTIINGITKLKNDLESLQKMLFLKSCSN